MTIAKNLETKPPTISDMFVARLELRDAKALGAQIAAHPRNPNGKVVGYAFDFIEISFSVALRSRRV